jgi:pimeloyl-ACP methyl ester carboxylesterase
MVADMMNPMDGQPRELRIRYKGNVYALSVNVRLKSDDLVVFLHGWGGSKECFAGVFSSDALKNYGLCTIDLLGFGKSEKPADLSYDLLVQANIVALAINSHWSRRKFI